MSAKYSICFPALAMVIFSLFSCSANHFRSNYTEVNSLLHESDSLQERLFLKAHLKNGDVCILRDSWNIDTLTNVVMGYGDRFDFNRSKVYTGIINIPIDSVAIFETNKKLETSEAERIVALSLLAGVDILVGIYCYTNPKACFGSCPTFYINNEDNFHYADAEGFSNAISPSLEYYDIDALSNKPLTQRSFSITMRNEALETHCVKDIKLLAYPRKAGERVFQSPSNDFYLCQQVYPLSHALAEEGDITGLIVHDDRRERFSYTDPKNLSSREEIYLEFDHVEDGQNTGLILNFRQTLMTTYFIHNALGYMGDNISDIFARIEQSTATYEKLRGGIVRELGKIDVYMWNEDSRGWLFQGGFYETGPIAINRQIIPLTHRSVNGKVRLKLVLNKGLWRIEYAALTEIMNRVEPTAISPDLILKQGIPDPNALTNIINPDRYLISMPGSEYQFNFTMPLEGTDYELFLYSRGYYLIWMREHWFRDKDLRKLNQMVEHPVKYLRQEASRYKHYEKEMEKDFWNSRIDTKTFSYYED